MPIYIPIEGIVLPPSSPSPPATGSGGTSRIIDVGDLPDGVSQGETDSSQHADVADSLELSSAAQRAARSTTHAPSTNPVGIEPNPTPKPRSLDAEAVPSHASRTPEYDSISVDPLPFPHPDPLDSASALDTRA